MTSPVRQSGMRMGRPRVPAMRTRSIALIRRVAAGLSPRCSSSITADQKVPIGLAMPLPMMSKAEPWIGSNIDG